MIPLAMLGGILIATAVVYGLYKVMSSILENAEDARKYRESQNEKED